MAKSSRSSTKKENNRRKAAAVFGPAELARDERLSAKLLELARQPKPSATDVTMDASDDDVAVAGEKQEAGTEDAAMDIDPKRASKAPSGKKRVERRRQKKSSIVFTRYSDRLASKTKTKKKGSP